MRSPARATAGAPGPLLCHPAPMEPTTTHPAALDVEAPARDLVTALRADADDRGPDALTRRLYDDLRRLAKAHRARWHGNHTMNTTAIVHEAYLKVAEADPFEGKGHFLGVASRAMRQVLVSYAENRRALKRGGGHAAASLDDAPPGALLTEPQVEEVLTVDGALSRLAALDERAARVVEGRVFGGLSVEETAAALGVSTATVARDWRRARAWLRGELGVTPPEAISTLA